MRIEERFEVQAPAEAVWAFLLAPERISPCIPGCKELAVEHPGRYRAVISRVRALAGVRAVITAQDLSDVRPFTEGAARIPSITGRAGLCRGLVDGKPRALESGWPRMFRHAPA